MTDEATTGRQMLDLHAATMPQRRAIEAFLDWLGETHNVDVGEIKADDGMYVSMREALDEYLGIDAAQLERERRALLERAQTHAEGSAG